MRLCTRPTVYVLIERGEDATSAVRSTTSLGLLTINKPEAGIVAIWLCLGDTPQL